MGLFDGGGIGVAWDGEDIVVASYLAGHGCVFLILGCVIGVMVLVVQVNFYWGCIRSLVF